jgi:hypothetical protein
VDKVWSRSEINGLRFSVYLVLRFAKDASHPLPSPRRGKGGALRPGVSRVGAAIELSADARRLFVSPLACGQPARDASGGDIWCQVKVMGFLGGVEPGVR